MTDASTAAPSTVEPDHRTRSQGTRSRAGSNMGRSRSGILAGAARCIARYGTRKTTMGDIAREGGVAKATLYNHFRTKDDVYAALVVAEVQVVLGRVAAVSAPPGSAESVVEALTAAASWLSEHPVVRRLADSEPALAARLARPGDDPIWQEVRAEALRRVSLAQAAGALHAQHDARVAVDTLLRWVLSHALWPTTGEHAEAAARQLVAGLREGTRAAGTEAGASTGFVRSAG